jgi:hypothetical protein
MYGAFVYVRMDILPFGFRLALFHYISPSKDNLHYHSHSKELPNSPGKALVRLARHFFEESVKSFHPGNVIILITGIISAGLFGNIGISEWGADFILFCFA